MLDWEVGGLGCWTSDYIESEKYIFIPSAKLLRMRDCVCLTKTKETLNPEAVL